MRCEAASRLFSSYSIHFILLGEGEGLPFLGTCRQFFLKNNAFQTILFITFCNKNDFYDHFKNVTGFFMDLI